MFNRFKKLFKKQEKQEKTVTDVLLDCIELSKKAQDSFCDMKNSIGTLSYLKEFCSIRLSVGRQQGHTTAAMRLMSEAKMNIGYIGPNFQQVRFFENMYKNRKEKNGKLLFCASFLSDFEMILSGKDFKNLDVILIDDFGHIGAHPKYIEEKIYELNSFFSDKNKYKFFIFLE